MKRYWFTFIKPRPFSPFCIGCGITAIDYHDALKILSERILVLHHELAVQEVIEDMSIDSLDAGHVVPNMGNVAVRGVWFPLGY